MFDSVARSARRSTYVSPMYSKSRHCNEDVPEVNALGGSPDSKISARVILTANGRRSFVSNLLITLFSTVMHDVETSYSSQECPPYNTLHDEFVGPKDAINTRWHELPHGMLDRTWGLAVSLRALS